MTEALGTAGRQARRLAQERMQAWAPSPGLAPASRPLPEPRLPLVQRAEAEPPAAERAANDESAQSQAGSGAATERETTQLTPEEVADRVYQLMCEELRRDRERRGRW